LPLDQTTHLQDAGTNAFQFEIELLAEMITHGAGLVSENRMDAASLNPQCYGIMTKLPVLRGHATD
jgi:hypothetical protein